MATTPHHYPVNHRQAAGQHQGNLAHDRVDRVVFDTVVAPAHYVGHGGIQPIDYVMTNKMPFAEGNVVKYITRHASKNGAEDVRKAIRYCQFILEKVYNEKT